MEQQFEEIREQQKASWNKFSPGWKKWDNLFMDFLEPMGQQIIHSLNLRESDLVLDIAAGTGEPGLSIASSLKDGKVIITDLSEQMLDIAKENAVVRGIRNIETVVCDVSELPFENDLFDAISCRLGFMFFPDMQLAADEMMRVLKEGGRMATSVWSIPENNFWITAMMSSIQKYMELPAPQPNAPGIFRCSKEGVMAEVLRKAGFKKISIREVTGKLKCDTAETYWNIMTEVAAPVVAALEKADDLTRAIIKNEVIQLIKEKYPNGQIHIPSSALIVCGEKPRRWM